MIKDVVIQVILILSLIVGTYSVVVEGDAITAFSKILPLTSLLTWITYYCRLNLKKVILTFALVCSFVGCCGLYFGAKSDDVANMAIMTTHRLCVFLFHYALYLSIIPFSAFQSDPVESDSGQDIPPHVIYSFAKSPNLVGVKECVAPDRVREYTDREIVMWSGNDDQCHDSRWDHGGTEVPYVPLPLEKRLEFVNIVKEIGRENFVEDKDVQVLEDDDFILLGRY
ncbi:hypothetical protein ACFE04_015972 [Oxalis oulophora]